MAPYDLAAEIVTRSQSSDGPEKIDAIYLSPDAYAKRTDADTIAEQMNDVFREKKFPLAGPADNDRVGGWMLMYQMLREGYWLIADNCTQLIETLPMLVRDEKNVEDVLKMDGDDAPDSARYGLKTRLAPRRPPIDQRIAAKVTSQDPTTRALQAKRAMFEEQKKHRPVYLRRRRFPWAR